MRAAREASFDPRAIPDLSKQNLKEIALLKRKQFGRKTFDGIDTHYSMHKCEAATIAMFAIVMPYPQARQLHSQLQRDGRGGWRWVG